MVISAIETFHVQADPWSAREMKEGELELAKWAALAYCHIPSCLLACYLASVAKECRKWGIISHDRAPSFSLLSNRLPGTRVVRAIPYNHVCVCVCVWRGRESVHLHCLLLLIVSFIFLWSPQFHSPRRFIQLKSSKLNTRKTPLPHAWAYLPWDQDLWQHMGGTKYQPQIWEKESRRRREAQRIFEISFRHMERKPLRNIRLQRSML